MSGGGGGAMSIYALDSTAIISLYPSIYLSTYLSLSLSLSLVYLCIHLSDYELRRFPGG